MKTIVLALIISFAAACNGAQATKLEPAPAVATGSASPAASPAKPSCSDRVQKFAAKMPAEVIGKCECDEDDSMQCSGNGKMVVYVEAKHGESPKLAIAANWTPPQPPASEPPKDAPPAPPAPAKAPAAKGAK